MKLFRKAAIIGTGLIGGSIALDIKKKKLADCVVGVSRRKESLAKALKIKAIDRGSQKLKVIEGADLLILAAPVETIINLAPEISTIIGPECIVIDVASTKEDVVSALRKIFPKYIGTHPLAGSQKRGIENAAAGIFEGSLCVLTPVKNTDPQAASKVRAFWEKLGARTALVSPGEHDRILSFTSHLPHTCAFSLINTLPEKYLKFCAGSFKDATRIAASDPGLWADIFLTNRKNIIASIRKLEKNLSLIKESIRKNDRKKLTSILNAAKRKRDRL